MDEPAAPTPSVDETVDKPASNEEQLRYFLDTMRSSIEQSTSPQFKSFWQARERCIPLFKEGIHPAVRSLLWQQFRDLSKEARMLSDLLGEQAAFAGEQIGIAIGAIEEEMEGIEALAETVDPLTLPVPSRVLDRQLTGFDPLHRRLTLYSRWTDRIPALRKELIATEMRIREKNALFKRLSAVGDRAFPQRKEFSEEISDRFLKVVEQFVSAHFSEEGYAAPFFVVKNEIKALQALAKTLTLTSKAFKEARISLSGCWDRVRASEKEKKEESRERQVADREVADALIAEVAAAKGELSGAELEGMLQKITKRLREADLGKGEFKSVHSAITEVKEGLAEEAKQAREAYAHESRV